MVAYATRRLVLLIPTVLTITFTLYVAVRLIPGDFVDQLSTDEQFTPEQRDALYDRYSLNTGLVPGYAEWLGDLARGDLGRSLVSNRSIRDDLVKRVPPSIEMGAIGLVVAVLIGVPIGTVSAMKQESKTDLVLRSLAVMLVAVPNFWLGLLVISYGYAWFGWAPPLTYAELWEDPIQNLSLMLIPGIILGGSLAGSVMRLTRSAVLEVTRQDYVRTARAKGIGPMGVVSRHVVRNALIPIVTLIGVQVPIIIGGTIVLESLFSVPGMARYLLGAIQSRDYPVVQAVVLISALVVLVSNFLVDMSYSIIDPRVRYDA